MSCRLVQGIPLPNVSWDRFQPPPPTLWLSCAAARFTYEIVPWMWSSWSCLLQSLYNTYINVFKIHTSPTEMCCHLSVHSGQKSMLFWKLQNVTKCSRTSRYFWHYFANLDVCFKLQIWWKQKQRCCFSRQSLNNWEWHLVVCCSWAFRLKNYVKNKLLYNRMLSFHDGGAGG